MPIQINYKKLPVEPRVILSALQAETDSFGIFFNLDRILYHEARYKRAAARMYPEFHAMAGRHYLRVTERAAVRDILQHRLGVPPYKLADKGGKESLSKEVVAELLKDSTLGEDARRFLELYKEISVNEYMTSYMRQYSTLPLSVADDMDNQRMVVAHPNWNLLATSRFSADSPSVQNINRDVCDIYTAPKGWQLVFSDSGQIEPRITYSAFIRDTLISYLITLYDDAYYGLLHYILLSEQDEQAARAEMQSIKKFEITADIKDKRQRLKVLGLAGNYGSYNLACVDGELGPIYERKIVNHPLRREWESRVTAEVRNGADHFYAYFGTPIYPGDTQKYVRGSQGWAGHLIRCGINNPVQATASELMCVSIVEAKKILGPHDHIGSYKHDEGMFYVREDSVDVMAPKLRECLAYEVEGWIPIGSDLHVGRKESPHVSNLF